MLEMAFRGPKFKKIFRGRMNSSKYMYYNMNVYNEYSLIQLPNFI